MRRLSSDEIKAIELSIMKELDRICHEHGLTYSLAYGTALGAARHAGFIPWDDDIDVFMPRHDYERLYELHAKGALSEGRYRLCSYRDRSSIYQFFKLIDTRTVSYETFVGRSRPIGLWVDIFPLEPTDGASKATLAHVQRRNARTGLLRSFAVADPTVGSSRPVIVAKRIVGPFARRFDLYRLAAKLDDNARSVSGGAATGADPSSCRRWLDVLGENRPLDGSLLFPTKPVAFEDAVFQGPARMDDYLTAQYGAWRVAPPVEERAVHFPEAYLLDEAE